MALDPNEVSRLHCTHRIPKFVSLIPLGIFPSTLPSWLVHNAMKYSTSRRRIEQCSIRLLIVSTGLSVMTPRVVPSRTVPNPYLQYWLPMSLNHPATFKALLLSSLSHMVINNFIPADPNATLTPVGEILSHLRTCYLDAISSINEGLQSPITATYDASILAVLMCVENPLTYEKKARAFVSPFRPPLQGLQWLNIHSAREPNLSHQDGLCKLIGLRGGLSKIETPGLAAAAF